MSVPGSDTVPRGRRVPRPSGDDREVVAAAVRAALADLLTPAAGPTGRSTT